LELNSAGVRLEPGERYEYWVTATNSDGTGGSQSNAHTFTASSEEPPSIVSEGVSNITATDATLEAAIEPRAWHGAYYQFQLVKEASEYATEILCPPTLHPGIDGCVGPQGAALPIGWVPGNLANPLAAQPVQLDLAGAGVTLQPGTIYHYRVLAARRVQTEDTIEWEPPTVFGEDRTFTTTSEPPSESRPKGEPPLDEHEGTPKIGPPHGRHHHYRRRHHHRHKRGLHRSKLHRAGHAG
jgi:hypothetical protein